MALLRDRLDELVDLIAEKLNWLLQEKEAVSNKKGYLNSTNANYYPNIPAVNAGLVQAVIEAADYTDEQIDIILLALDNKVDKIPGKGLSANDFTNELKAKLEALEGTKFRGAYPNLTALKAAYPEGASASWHQGESGFYADVGGSGADDIRYTWDPNDYKWIESGLAGLTPEQVKQLYLENSDTNNFSDAWLSKLDGIEEGAQKNVQSDMAETDSTKDSYVKNKKTKLSQFQNDKNFVSDQWVLDQGYLDQHQDLSAYALKTAIKDGKLTLKATGDLSGGTKEFTANQDGNVEFNMDLSTAAKAKLAQAHSHSNVDILDLITQETLDLIRDDYIIGKGTKKITVSGSEPANPMQGDLWIEIPDKTVTDDVSLENQYFSADGKNNFGGITGWDRIGGLTSFWRSTTDPDLPHPEYPEFGSYANNPSGSPDLPEITYLTQIIEIADYTSQLKFRTLGFNYQGGRGGFSVDYFDKNDIEIGNDELIKTDFPIDEFSLFEHTFENVPENTKTARVGLLTSRSGSGHAYVKYAGLEVKAVREIPGGANPLLWFYDSSTNQWLPFGAEEEDYPDYAQQLIDGLNF